MTNEERAELVARLRGMVDAVERGEMEGLLCVWVPTTGQTPAYESWISDASLTDSVFAAAALRTAAARLTRLIDDALESALCHNEATAEGPSAAQAESAP